MRPLLIPDQKTVSIAELALVRDGSLHEDCRPVTEVSARGRVVEDARVGNENLRRC